MAGFVKQGKLGDKLRLLQEADDSTPVVKKRI